MSFGDDVAAGALGGLAAGMVMSGMMMMGRQAGFIQEPLPLKVERWAEDRIGMDLATRPSPGQQMALAQVGHLIYSTALGAGFGALRTSFGLPAMPSGPLYGLGVYAANLLGVGPALDITAGPWNEAPATVGRRVMMHLVFGTVTALVADRIRPRLA